MLTREGAWISSAAAGQTPQRTDLCSLELKGLADSDQMKVLSLGFGPCRALPLENPLGSRARVGGFYLWGLPSCLLGSADSPYWPALECFVSIQEPAKMNNHQLATFNLASSIKIHPLPAGLQSQHLYSFLLYS